MRAVPHEILTGPPLCSPCQVRHGAPKTVGRCGGGGRGREGSSHTVRFCTKPQVAQGLEVA